MLWCSFGEACSRCHGRRSTTWLPNIHISAGRFRLKCNSMILKCFLEFLGWTEVPWREKICHLVSFRSDLIVSFAPATGFRGRTLKSQLFKQLAAEHTGQIPDLVRANLQWQVRPCPVHAMVSMVVGFSVGTNFNTMRSGSHP
jgi:hypothetical protein